MLIYIYYILLNMSIEKPVAQKNDVHAVCEGQFQFDKGRTGPCMVKKFFVPIACTEIFHL